MTELDLNALGIWWIPVPSPCDVDDEALNVWAIEDVDGGVALFDSGVESEESLDSIAHGLDRMGARLADVTSIVLSHAHPEHCGGARRVIERARFDVQVFASDAEARALRGEAGRVVHIRCGHRFPFRHFTATALVLPGHAPGLVALFSEQEQLLFSSDLLVGGTPPVTFVDDGAATGESLGALSNSLRRIAALEVRVVLPGRGAPFAGHRRAVREALAFIGGREARGISGDGQGPP